jgi:cold shock CspA family protein
MAKSKETHNKKEKEKKRLKQRQEKFEKMEERKANAKKGKSLEDMMAYIDENGNLSDTPPDPRNKKIFKQEDMQLGVPPRIDDDDDSPRAGTVLFFDEKKGFGFITDEKTGERIFVHINNLSMPIKAADKVSFEIESGPRGLSAVNIQKPV